MVTDQIKQKNNFLLLNAGPSLNDNTSIQFKKFAKKNNCMVGAVKGAFYHTPEIVDYLWYNCSNLPVPNEKTGQFYDFSRYRPKVVTASSNYPLGIRIDSSQDFDIWYPVPFIPISEYLVFSRQFDKNLNTSIKTVAPGIIGETVLPDIVEMGINKLFVAGWNLSKSSNGEYEHCWSNSEEFKVKGYNPPDAELQAWIDASYDIYNWLDSHGVSLYLIGNKSNLDERIPRINI